MMDFFHYYGLDLVAPALSIYAVYLLAGHQAEKPVGGLRRRRSGIMALAAANMLWIVLGLMWTQVIPIVFVNILFAVVYYRNHLVRRRLRREFATRRMSRTAEGIDVLC